MEKQRWIDCIGIVSHEVRSPLNLMNGYLQLLERKVKKKIMISCIILYKKPDARQIDLANFGKVKIEIDYKLFDMADLVNAAESESLSTIGTYTIIYHQVRTIPLFTWIKIKLIS
ncbi:hypothetical protein ODZ84_22880 [Chryseobacterium fluminis]|uniref:hypothetical protein n=1 Tax=Chryseobacterium fluminis TaxID=2983606 RepID=UPI0022557788|nr:hypothetical protein [Chryseobacterium sp. MMS21-Ot14]UZT97972.1 hypothetical protein ODZ84_22880 [Chryseobacterium sp. MMS21-Ot14]